MSENQSNLVRWLVDGLSKEGKSQSGLARHLGVDPSAVNKMVHHKREIKGKEIAKIAQYLGEPAPFTPHSGYATIVGSVGANPDGQVLYEQAYTTGEIAPLPPGATHWAAALHVRGHSMPGFAEDGALIYYEDRRDPPTEDMLGEVAIVGLDTGEVLLKRLLRGSRPGLYDLESIAGPTRRDARVVWAGRISAIIPPWKARQIIFQHID